MPVDRPTTTLDLTHGQFDQVKITDHDNDVFYMGLGAAIKACKRAREREVDYNHDALEILVLLEQFFAAQGEHFSKVAFRAEADRLHLYFSSKAAAFDVNLSEKLAELESGALDRLIVIKIDTRQVSAAELEEIRTMSQLSEHAEQRPAHQHVETQ